jgi:uncharacterized protein (DUF2225 family)
MNVFSGEGELYHSSCDDTEYVLKIQKEYNRNEIKFQINAASIGIAPPIYEVWFCSFCYETIQTNVSRDFSSCIERGPRILS